MNTAPKKYYKYNESLQRFKSTIDSLKLDIEKIKKQKNEVAFNFLSSTLSPKDFSNENRKSASKSRNKRCDKRDDNCKNTRKNNVSKPCYNYNDNNNNSQPMNIKHKKNKNIKSNSFSDEIEYNHGQEFLPEDQVENLEPDTNEDGEPDKEKNEIYLNYELEILKLRKQMKQLKQQNDIKAQELITYEEKSSQIKSNTMTTRERKVWSELSSILKIDSDYSNDKATYIKAIQSAELEGEYNHCKNQFFSGLNRLVNVENNFDVNKDNEIPVVWKWIKYMINNWAVLKKENEELVTHLQQLDNDERNCQHFCEDLISQIGWRSWEELKSFINAWLAKTVYDKKKSRE